MYCFPISCLFLSLLAGIYAAASESVSQQNKDEMFKTLFLSNLQRHLHEGDMEAAARAAKENPSGSTKFYSKFSETPIRENMRRLTSTKELITEESYRLQGQSDLGLYKKAFRSTSQDLEAAQEQITRLDQNLSFGQNYLFEIQKQLMAARKEPPGDEVQARIERLENLRKAQNQAVQRTFQKIQYIKNVEKIRLGFIEHNPKYFLKKKHFSKDQLGISSALEQLKFHGDGQAIAFYDNYSKSMPDRLKEKCVNPEQLTNEHEEKPSTHGVAVASVAVDSKIGIAQNAKFRTLLEPGSTLSTRYQELPEDIPVLPVEGTELTEMQLRALGIFVWTGTKRIAIKSQGYYYILDLADDSLEFPEKIVNMSAWNKLDVLTDDRSKDHHPKRLPMIVEFAAMLHRWMKNGKVIVVAAGNYSAFMGVSQSYSILRAFSTLYPWSFIVAVGLEPDQTTISKASNQPGDHALQHVSLCASGKSVKTLKLDGTLKLSDGTSFSAPMISGAMALLASNYPEANMQDIVRALLDSASPVVFRKSQSRLYKSPYVLRDVSAAGLVPGTYTYFKKTGLPARIDVTEEMIKEGKKRYGNGLLNVYRAMNHLDRRFKRRIH